MQSPEGQLTRAAVEARPVVEVHGYSNPSERPSSSRATLCHQRPPAAPLDGEIKAINLPWIAAPIGTCLGFFTRPAEPSSAGKEAASTARHLLCSSHERWHASTRDRPRRWKAEICDRVRCGHFDTLCGCARLPACSSARACARVLWLLAASSSASSIVAV